MSKHKSHDDRAYQQEIVDAVLEYLRTKSGNPVVASPGGTGKSHCMNRIIKYMVTGWAGTRVMLLAQDAKLLDQNCNSMLSFWPNAPVGIYSSQLRSRDTLQPIIYAGIQSVAKRPHEFGFIDAVFVDECDQVSHKGETLYQKFIAALKEINPGLRVIGFTATPYRLGMGCLTNIDLWDEICIDLTKTERFNWFIEHGFLSPLVTKKTCKEIDVSLIGMKGGEFNDHEMQEVADTDELNRAVVEECIRYGHDRKHWLVFATGVKHGHHLAKLFNSKGVRAVMLSGEDSVQHREEMEAAFRAGEYRCLVNVGLYGRGWDFPALDLLAWARATQSTSLWVQGCVRGTRRAEGKENCIASGQRVLTDQGLVPIEKITREMKVWDGVDFVAHSGIISRGHQSTITYAGLTATPDHLVKTQDGWKTLWESLIEQANICVTGTNASPIREAENHFRGGSSTTGTYGQSTRFSAMCNLWKSFCERLHKRIKESSRLPKVRKETVQTANASAVALQPLLRCNGKMQQRSRQEVFGLRWAWYHVLVFISEVYGRLGDRKLRASETPRVRQNRQQRSLHSGEPTILHGQSTSVTYKTEFKQHKSEPLSATIPTDPLRGFYLTRILFSWLYRQGDCQEILPTVVQTKREVWDILNCGPRHSFTCEGLLVHNCLVLDFAGNTRRLGPINLPITPSPRRKGDDGTGEAPVKECPECHSYIHTRIMVCPDCGYEFPPPSTVKKTASEDEILRSNKTREERIVEHACSGVRYKPILSKKNVYYLRCSYFVGTGMFHESLFFDSPNAWAKRKLEKWWKYRGGKDPFPEGTDEAAKRTEELRVPTKILVDLNSEYKDVVGVNFDAVDDDGIEDDDIPF